MQLKIEGRKNICGNERHEELSLGDKEMGGTIYFHYGSRNKGELRVKLK